MIGSELQRLFFEESSDALLAVEIPSGLILGANRSFSSLTAFEAEEIESESVTILNSGLGPAKGRERKLDLAILNSPGFYNDIVLATREGQMRLLTVKVRHVTLDKKQIALAVLSDDTERQLLVRDLMTKHQSLEAAYAELESVHSQLKRSQEEMAQSAKLAALGELAAGLSHELNQPLTGIRGFAQEINDMLRTEKKPKKKVVAEHCNDIISNADKMAKLLSHFRNFARQEKKNYNTEYNQPETVEMAKCLEQVARLLSRRLEKHNIALELPAQRPTELALGDEHPIEQIIINLITNSRDALMTKMKHSDTSSHFHPKIRVSLEKNTEHVLLRVEDNGDGIPENIRNRIFDPFFSTKEIGHGMGLGLSISYGIAHRFGGELLLEKSDSNGSSFVLRLKNAETATKISCKKEAA